jgi:hypothetical protein
MHAAIVIAFVVVLAAWPLGRWRANVWIKENMPSRDKHRTHPRLKDPLSPHNQSYEL